MGLLGNGCWPGPAQLWLQSLAHSWHTGRVKTPTKPPVSTDSQSVDLNRRTLGIE